MHPILFKIPLPHWKVPYPAFADSRAVIYMIVGLVLGLLAPSMIEAVKKYHWAITGVAGLLVGFLATKVMKIPFQYKMERYELSTFPIYAYGVMLGLSLVVGWYISLTIAKDDGLPRETMANNYVFTAIMAILGARVLFIVTNLDSFESWKDWFAIRSGGLVAYGGFLGGFLGSWYYCASKKVRLMAWADAAVPSLASGLLFTRLGCYMYGCDFGKPLKEGAPKLLEKLGTFPEWYYDQRAGKYLDEQSLHQLLADPANKPQILKGSPAWEQHMHSFPQVRELHHSLPVHPTQLYESLTGLFLLGLLFWARKHMKAREKEGEPFFRGEIFLLFTFGYGVLRFMLEMVRDDAERGTYGPHFEPHIIYPVCLMVLALAFVFGLSNMVSERFRVIAKSVAILIPLAVFLVLRPANKFAAVDMVQLSTSQWIALLTGAMAAVYYRRGLDIAVADPAVAADLGAGVPELVEMEAAMARGEEWKKDEGDDEDEESDEPAADEKAAGEKVDAKKVADKKADDKKPDDKKVADKKADDKKADDKKADDKKVDDKKAAKKTDDDDEADEKPAAKKDEPKKAEPKKADEGEDE
ncbi:MAG: prolipoprotein diacylglyceryl transferase [Myxococcales bacterium]|nr:prolipoprotein diacylglyceryl transferase [Myxococcales bacterium]